LNPTHSLRIYHLVLSSPILETFSLHRIKTNFQINQRNLQLNQRNLQLHQRNLQFSLRNPSFNLRKLRLNLEHNPQERRHLNQNNNLLPDQVVFSPLIINTIYVLDQIWITRNFIPALNNNAENFDAKQK